MIKYILWAVLFGVDIFEFFRILFGCIYIYMYMYMYIYIRENLYHTLSFLYAHTHAHGEADG